MTTHNPHNRQTSLPPAELEPAIPATERSQTHTLDRAATGIGVSKSVVHFFLYLRLQRLSLAGVTFCIDG